MRRTLMKLPVTLAFAACALSVAGCNTVPIHAALDCSSLVGPTLRAPVSPSPLPSGNTVGEWVAFGDAQSGRLDEANGRKLAVVEIMDACQAQQANLTRKPWWRLF